MHGTVCIGDAINWDAPLNRGLISWWLSLPGQHRGNVARDLCGRTHGILTNSPTPSGSIGRTGGWGSHTFVGGSSQSIAMGTIAATQNLSQATLVGWARRPTAGTISCFGTTGVVGSEKRLQILWFSDNVIYYTCHNVFPSVALTSSDWQFLGISINGTAVTAYRNGVQVGSATAGTSGTSTVGNFNIGTTGASRFTTGQHDDVRFYNRDLGVSGHRELYRASCQGYPEELNWTPSLRGYEINTGGGGGFNAYWVRHPWQVIGGGVS